MDCIFCKIVAREIPSNIVFQDENVVAFRDINPQAPVHIVLVPAQHLSSLLDIRPENSHLIGDLTYVATVLAEREGIAKSGFRLVMNCGPDAGQTVDHIHMHLLGGRAMQWPPG
ncbi:MAG TPA: histidine triad nucleotide-binding protein [Chloroflexota bacterium]|nr:histidine triad nucleotide-binding protein [Chloroflexota bacterium]